MKKNNIIFIFFLIALTLFLLSFFQLDPDYLWHIKAGEYMFQHGILKHDVFSWFVQSKSWMSHEWLFEIIIYSLKKVFGNYHLLIYCFSTTFFLLFTIYFANRKYISSNPFFAIIWFLCSILLTFMMQGRPHLLSNCFLSLTIYFLYDLYLHEDSKKIYFLPLISILWANVHGGSSNLVYLLCLLFIIFGSFEFKFSKITSKRIHKKQYMKYSIVMVLCILGIIINPHGISMLLYPYQNMMDSTMIQNITEWRSTSLNEITHYVYFIFLIFIIFIMLFSKKKIEWMDLILLGLSTYLGLKSIRFWFYTYIIMSYVIFSYLPKEKNNHLNTAYLFFSCLFLLLFFSRKESILISDYHYLLDKNDILEIKKENPKHLFNMYDYGGDLIYQGIPVFIDGRADLYGKYNYKDYLNISLLKGDFVSIIEKYPFDYFLVDQKYPISTYLKYNENYLLIYQNKDVLFYKKKNV